MDSGRCELIVVGDEILLGQTLDSNSRYIARRLTDNGMRLHWISVVPDDKDEIKTALDRATGRASAVIITGGLGPTADDFTRPVIAGFFADNLVWRQDLADAILARFEKRAIRPSPGWETMAYFPSRAAAIPNAHGAAPGIHYNYVRDHKGATAVVTPVADSLQSVAIEPVFREAGRQLFALPGVPVEMRGMFEDYILPRLIAARKGVFESRIFKTVGAGETHLAACIGDPAVLAPATLAFLPSLDQGVTLRLSCSGDDVNLVHPVLEKGSAIIRTAIQSYIYATEEIPLEAVIIDILRYRGWKAAFAESCTGGMISARLTSIPGASDVFERCFVTYSNQAKVELLGVAPDIIENYGAVSEQCARAMAEGACQQAKVDIAISVTGIAGPGGGTVEKPVGLVYIGVADRGGSKVKRFTFAGDRDDNRRRAALAALTMLYRKCINA